MFAMPQHTYAYPAQPPPPPRQYPSHGTSSAFSSSANPDEDWTKISDLAERRRIQNRIAQRNYRKKLKRRLEDLERRAGKSDGTSSGSDKAGQQNKSNKQRPAPAPKTSKPAAPVAAPQKATPQQPFTPPMPDDEYLFRNAYDERERSHSPLFANNYSTYPPPPEDMLSLPPYSAPHSYRPMTAEIHTDYMTPTTVPVSLPSMTHFHDAFKREQGYPGPEESMYTNYNGYMPGLEMGAGGPSPYDHSNPHTPPLSHSFDHSASCSDSGSYDAYPTTPLSMPGSPCMVQQQM